MKVEVPRLLGTENTLVFMGAKKESVKTKVLLISMKIPKKYA